MELFIVACFAIIGSIGYVIGRYLLMPQPQKMEGVYRCRKCGMLIPLGFGHRLDYRPGAKCEVVDRSKTR